MHNTHFANAVMNSSRINMAEDDEKDESHKLFALDTTQQAGFCDFFWSLPNAEDTVRFFLRSNYYTVHGDNADFIARHYIRSDRCIQLIGPKHRPLPSCIVNGKLFDEIIADLWQRARLEVWENQGRSWEVIKRCSPGNTDDFEDVLAHEEDAAVTVAAKFKEEAGRLKFSCAVCNVTQRVLGFGDFVDSDQLVNFEAFCIQARAKECLLPAAPKGSSENTLVGDVLKRLGIVCTEVRRNDFAPKADNWAALQPLLREGTVLNEEPQMLEAVGALAALAKYLRLEAEAPDAARFAFQRVELQRYMRLDATAVRALSLFPETPGPFEQTTNRQAGLSLFGLLNQCRTPMGSRTLKQWITQPLMDLQEIVKRQNLIELFTDDVLFKQAIRDDILRKVPDLDGLIRKFHKKRARIGDTVALGRLLALLPTLKGTLQGYHGVHATLLQLEFLEPLEELSGHLANLQQLITSTLDFSDPTAVVIAPSFDEELQELSDRRTALDKKIDKAYHKALEDLQMDSKSVKLERSQPTGHYFKVSRQKDAALRSSTKYTILETRKDGVRFTSTELLGLNKSRKDLQEAYEKRQADIEGKLQETVASYMPLLEELADLATTLDVLSALAHVVLQAPVQYTRPTVLPSERAVMHIEGARHPMLETQQSANFIPNNVHLGRDSQVLQLITGPNMGGKSTYLRTAALLQHMAQMGMFLPCRSATLSLRDCILARVGAADYQTRGISTFMAEMLETSAILNTATQDSLVIIDELGRGTSTHDGFGLAWAIAKEIATGIGAFCLFATHFHELTALPGEYPQIGNLHVMADTQQGQLVMLYEVRPGPCSKSFGIHVAELARFPETVVAMAKRKATELETYDSGPVCKQAKLTDDADTIVAEFLDKLEAALTKEAGDQEALRAAKAEFERRAAGCPVLQRWIAEAAA